MVCLFECVVVTVSGACACGQAYDAWVACGGGSERRRFCKDNFLSFETMHLIHETRRDLLSVSL